MKMENENKEKLSPPFVNLTINIYDRIEYIFKEIQRDPKRTE